MRRLERTVIGGLALFAGLVILQHPLRGDLPAGEHFVSEYAHGSTAALQVLAFAGWTAALLAGAALTARAARPDRPVARGLTVAGLALAGAGIALAAVFATQTVAGVLPPGRARTTEGLLHDLGTLAAFAGMLVAAVASLRLVPARGYRATLACLTALLVMTVPLLVALGLDAPGIGQRVFIAVACVFLWRLTAALLRTPPRPRFAA